VPIGTLLEKLGFRQRVEETLKVKRLTRAMPAYPFIWRWCWPVTWVSRDCVTCAFCSRAHVDGNLGRVAAPAAVYFLAVPGLCVRGSVAGQLWIVGFRAYDGEDAAGAR